MELILLDTMYHNGLFDCQSIEVAHKNVLVTIYQIDSGCKTAKNAAAYFSQWKMFVQAPISNSSVRQIATVDTESKANMQGAFNQSIPTSISASSSSQFGGGRSQKDF